MTSYIISRGVDVSTNMNCNSMNDTVIYNHDYFIAHLFQTIIIEKVNYKLLNFCANSKYPYI